MHTLGASPSEQPEEIEQKNNVPGHLESMEGNVQVIEKYLEEEKYLEHTLIVLGNLRNDGLEVLFQQYPVHKVFDAIESVYTSQGKVRTYDLFCELMPEKAERLAFYEAVEAAAEKVGHENLQHHWGASFMGGGSAKNSMLMRIGYLRARDTFLGRILPDTKTESFLEFARPGGIEDLAKSLKDNPDLKRTLMYSLEETHGNVVTALDNLGTEHDKKVHLLHRDAQLLQMAIKKEIEKLDTESKVRVDEYRYQLLQDIEKIQKIALGNESAQQVLEEAVQKIEQQIEEFEEREEERLDELLVPFLSLHQRLGALFTLL